MWPPAPYGHHRRMTYLPIAAWILREGSVRRATERGKRR